MKTFKNKNSGNTYRKVLRCFCRAYDLTAEELARLPLEQIERMTEYFIHQNEGKLAPKTLNVVYCAVKRWLLYKRIIKNKSQFRQIKFDKTSRKTRDRAMLTKSIVKKLFDNADLEEKVVIGFYAINALRPSLIPQILIEDIQQQDIKLNPDSIELAEKTWIWVKREYEGNKASIEFPIITTSEQSAWLEEYLNSRIRKGEKLTFRSKIALVKGKRAVDYIVDKLFETVGFKGRRYLLRHYAFKRLKQAVEDYDLREWLMGHKGKISAVYDHEHYLTDQEINEYKAMIDTQVLHIYGLNRSQEEIIETRIETLKALLKDLDINDINTLKKELASGKITIDQFNEKMTKLAQDTMNKQIEDRFEQLFLKMNAKYSNH